MRAMRMREQSRAMRIHDAPCHCPLLFFGRRETCVANMARIVCCVVGCADPFSAGRGRALPNKVGRTMVWPIKDHDVIAIRCFMPGPMT